MERYDKVGYNIDVQQQALAFDDEYIVQMYTNLINNYTVFKSLTDDERNLQELESVHPEPVAPKFIKEIKEVQVDSPDLTDVEVRRVFVEEVTQAAPLASARTRPPCVPLWSRFAKSAVAIRRGRATPTSRHSGLLSRLSFP